MNAKVKLVSVRRAIVRLKGLHSIITVTYPRRFGGKVNETAVEGREFGGGSAALAKKAGEWKGSA